MAMSLKSLLFCLRRSAALGSRGGGQRSASASLGGGTTRVSRGPTRSGDALARVCEGQGVRAADRRLRALPLKDLGRRTQRGSGGPTRAKGPGSATPRAFGDVFPGVNTGLSPWV